MNIYIINKSSVLTDQEIQSWIPGLNKYVHIVREWWPRPAHLVWCDRSQEPLEAWKLIFADSSDIAGALGYHDYTPGHRPISYVFAADDLRYGYNPQVTAAHEIAEMIADPWISESFQVYDDQFYAKEICDPCEADDQGFQISTPGFPTITVSDFVYPMWFIPGASGKFDHQGLIKAPLQLLSGGYMNVFQSGKGWTQIYAETAGSGTKASKLAQKSDNFGRLERYGRPRGKAPTAF